MLLFFKNKKATKALSLPFRPGKNFRCLSVLNGIAHCNPHSRSPPARESPFIRRWNATFFSTGAHCRSQLPQTFRKVQSAALTVTANPAAFSS